MVKKPSTVRNGGQTQESKAKLLKLVTSINNFDIKELDVLFMKGRLKTFKNFVYDRQGAKCSSAKLAEAGFCNYTNKGEPDAICPFCGKLMTFDAEDDPWEEHRSHCPQCPFVKIGKTDETTWTVDNTIFLIAALAANSKKEAALQLTNDLSSMIETMMRKISQ